MSVDQRFAAASRLMLVKFAGLIALFIMGMVKAGPDLSQELNMFLGVLMSVAAFPVIQQTFYGGAPANVSLRVATGSALKLRITDTSDRNVCEKAAREASCRWMPLYTQMHRSELVNDQGENARYYFVFD